MQIFRANVSTLDGVEKHFDTNRQVKRILTNANDNEKWFVS